MLQFYVLRVKNEFYYTCVRTKIHHYCYFTTKNGGFWPRFNRDYEKLGNSGAKFEIKQCYANFGIQSNFGAIHSREKWRQKMLRLVVK